MAGRVDARTFRARLRESRRSSVCQTPTRRPGVGSTFVSCDSFEARIRSTSFSRYAQFTFTTNNGTLTITAYSGSATTLGIPDATNGYPITGIGAGAFLRHSALTNVLLPDSMVTVGDSAFASCFGLATINFPVNLATIGGSAFDGCKLITVAIPQGVTHIGYRAFAGCTTLEQITVDGLNPACLNP